MGRLARPAAVLALCLGGVVATAREQALPAMQLIEAACDSNLSTSAYRQCLAQFAEKVDRELNVLWPRVLDLIDAPSTLTPAQRADWKSKLTAAQLHWVQFRQADCREAVGYEWHDSRPTRVAIAISTCLAKHTLDRMQHLKERYEAQ